MGGSFSTSGYIGRKHLAAINLTNGDLTTWRPEVAGQVNAMVERNGVIYIGGAFTALGQGGQPASTAVTRFRLGAIDVATGAILPWNPSANGEVLSLAADNNGIYAGGYFNQIGNQQAVRLASLNPSTGSLNWHGNAGNIVSAVAIKNDTLYAGGSFQSMKGTTRNRLAALDAATGNLTSWNPDANNVVRSMAIHGDSVFICGDFTQVGGATRQSLTGINRLSGSPLAFSALSLGQSLTISSDDYFLYVAGSFYQIAGQPRQRIARFSLSDLTLSGWNVTGVGGSQIESLLAGNNQLFVGGLFTSMDSIGVNKLTWFHDVITEPIVIISHPKLCEGENIQFEAQTNIPNATYVWVNNGNPVGTNQSIYAYQPSNGDALSITVHASDSSCFTSSSASSSLVVNTIPVLTPSISISAPSEADQDATVTVTASIAGAGANYSIDWRLNNLIVATSTLPQYSFTKGAGQEIVRATLHADPTGCYTVENINSNSLTIAESVTGIGSLNNNAAGIKVYPVPADNVLFIEGLSAGDLVELFDVNGRRALILTAQTGSNQLSLQPLRAGNYFVHIRDKNAKGKASGMISKGHQ